MKNINTILVISPHTDDAELACGGTIAKLAEQNKTIYYVTFSSCRDTLVGNFPPKTIEEECRKATKTLGIKPKNCFIFNLKCKYFYNESRWIYEKLEKLKNLINPDLVIIPSLNDTHQDHSTVAEQAATLFRRSTSIISHEEPWNNMRFLPSFFVELSEEDMKKKYQALECYKTQYHFKKPFFDKEFIYGLARARGMQINAKYAESFEVVKYIIK
ncbi:MAG: PIG-L deacetylase family protein [bacterium]